MIVPLECGRYFHLISPNYAAAGDYSRQLGRADRVTRDK
jgi:hypothetical protein